MPITVGAHWHNIAQRTYPEPAVSVEHVYIAEPEDWPQYMERCRVLLENGWRVVLKVKWHPRQDTPPKLLDGTDYLSGLAHLLSVWHSVLNSPRTILTMGNEANWQAPGGSQPVPPATVAALFNGPGWPGSFIETVKHFCGEAQVWVPPVGPFAPYCPPHLLPTAGAIESSPWSAYAHDLYWRLFTSQCIEPPDGVLVHAYGRTGVDGSFNGDGMEPLMNVRDDHGWRWGSNVVETWLECLELVTGVGHELPWGIAETNTFTDAPSSRSYPVGWLPRFVEVLSAEANPPEFVAWFVDQDLSGGNWADESLSDGVGRMADAERDFEALTGSTLAAPA